VTVELVGWDQLARATAGVAGACDVAAARAADDAARALAVSLRPQLPVRTGRLRASVAVTPVDDGTAVTIGAPYAVYVRAARRAVAAAVDPAAADYTRRAQTNTAAELGRLPWP
jgi:Bacteriophage HK97-gp10, putative tail-component